MNKTYKVVWCQATQTFVAVSEFAKSKGKSSRVSGCVSSQPRFKLAKLSIALIAVFGLSGQAMAESTGVKSHSGVNVKHSKVGKHKLNWCYYDVTDNNMVCGDVNTKATSKDSVALGTGAQVTAEKSVAIGNNAKAKTNNSVAIGSNAKTGDTGSQQMAIGGSAIGSQSLAIGIDTKAKGDSSVAIGGDDLTSFAKNGTVWKAYKELTGEDLYGSTNGQGLGQMYQATTAGGGSVAIGVGAWGSGDLVTAVGANSVATQNFGVALGVGAKSEHSGAVAIGSGSKTTASTAVTKATVGAVTYGNFAGTAPTNVVSFGTTEKKRQLVNVAAGHISVDSTDAINGSQLFSVAQGLQRSQQTYFHFNDPSMVQGTGDATTNLGGIQDTAGATGKYAITAGIGAKAEGENSIAIGKDANATESGAVAIGSGAKASKAGATAFGYNTTAGGNYATAFGDKTVASGLSSTAFGLSTHAEGKHSTAFGQATKATALNSTAFGAATEASGDSSTAFGYNTTASGAGSTAFGVETTASGDYSAALGGSSNTASGASSAVVGGSNNSVAGENSFVAGGHDNNVYAKNSVALGSSNTIGIVGENVYILGSNVDASGVSNAVVLGDNSTAVAGAISVGSDSKQRKIKYVAKGDVSDTSTDAINGSQLFAVQQSQQTYFHVNDGTGSQGTGNAGTNLGGIQDKAGAKGKYAVTAGVDANATKEYSVAVGYSAKATHSRTIAIGFNAEASGKWHSAAIGQNAKATGEETLAVGSFTTASGKQSIAIGNDIWATGDRTIVIGTRTIGAVSGGNTASYDSRSTGSHAIAIGSGTTKGSDDNVAIVHGNYSIALGTSSETIKGADEVVAIGRGAKGNIARGVALGSQSVANRAALTNPDDAYVMAGADAAAVKATVKGNLGAVSVGVTGTDPTKTKTRQIINVAAGSEDSDAVNVAQLKAVANVAKTEVAGGTNIASVDKTQATDGHDIYTINAKGASVSAGNGVTVAPTTNATTNVTDYTVGIDFGSVASGDGKAVKGGDVYTAVTGAKTTVDTKGSILTIDETESADLTANNYVLGIDTSKLEAATDLTYKANGSGAQTVKLSDGLNFTNGKNTTASIDANGVVKYNVNDDITGLSSVVLGSNASDDNTVALTKTGINAGSKTITNVAAGTDDTDAVNVSQLNALQKSQETYFHVNDGTSGQGAGNANTNSGAIQDKAGATGKYAVTAGVEAQAKGDYSIAIGNNSHVAESLPTLPFPTIGGVAIGSDAEVTHNFGVAVGMFAEAKANGSTAIGYNSTAEGQSSTALGNANYITKDGAMGATIGMDSVLTVGRTGEKAYLSGEDIIQFDNNTIAGKNDGGGVLSLGHKAGDPSTKGGPAFTHNKRMQITNLAGGVGDYDAVNVLQLKAVHNIANAGFTIAGASATVSGKDAQIKPNETFHIVGDTTNNTDFTKSDAGKNIYTQVKEDNTLTIGLAKDLKGLNSVILGDALANDVVSLTKDGINAGSQKITNVSEGEINKASKDAINGSQLFDTNNQVAGNTTALGGGASYNPKTDTYTKPTYNTVDAAGNAIPGITPASNVGDALTNLNSYVNKGFNVQERGTTKGTVTPTESINFINGTLTTANVATESNGVTNITFDVDAQGIAEAAQQPVVYTEADGTKVYKKGNKFFTNPADPTTEVNPADIIASMQSADSKTTTGMKLTNVAAGTNATDAVNFSQLTTQVAASKEEVKSTDKSVKVTTTQNSAGANVFDLSVNADGETIEIDPSTGEVKAKTGDITSSKGVATAADPTGLATAGDIAKAINNSGFTAKANSDAGEFIGSGDSVDFKDGKNITVTRVGDEFTFATKDEVGFHKITVGGVIIDQNNGINAGDKKITNVTDGIIGVASKDAVNGSQIHNIADKNAKNVFGGNAAVAADGYTTFTDIGGTGENTIHDAIKSINTTANAGFTIKGASATTASDSQITPNDTFSIIGDKTNVDFTKSDAGKNIYTQVNADNTVQIGLAKDIEIDSVTTGGTKISDNGLVITGGPSVTKTGIDAGGKKITNVANGDINATSKDAVNGSQIHAISDANKDIFGGNATVQNDGTITMSDIGGTGKNNIHDAIASVNAVAGIKSRETVSAGDGISVVESGGPNDKDFKVSVNVDNTTTEIKNGNVVAKTTGITVNNGKVKAGNDDSLATAGNIATAINNSGFTAKANGDTGEFISSGTSVDFKEGKNITVTRKGSEFTFATKDEVDFNKITVGGVVIDNTTGINAGGTKITNVIAGTNPTDAVNVSQLQGVQSHIINIQGDVNHISDVVGVSDFDNNKDLLKTYNVDDQKEHMTNNVVTAIHRMNEEGIKFFHTNDENVDKSVDQGENPIDSSAGAKFSTAIGYQAKVTRDADNGLAIGKGATVSGKNSIAIGTGHVVSGNSSGAFGDPNIVSGNASYAVGNDNSVATDNTFVFGNAVTNTVENSVILGNQSASTAGNTVGTRNLTSDGRAGNTTTAGDTGVVDSATIDGVTYGGFAGAKSNGVVSVGASGSERRIQNVAAGEISATSTDAINGSQLYQAVNNLSHNANAGTATGIATANMPQPHDPGKSMISAGVGYYEGESALAVGASSISDNGKWIIKGSLSIDTQSNAGVGAGVGYQW